MATFNRARVCTLGTQEDMVRLCRLLLDHCQWFDEEDDDVMTPEEAESILDSID